MPPAADHLPVTASAVTELPIEYPTIRRLVGNIHQEHWKLYFFKLVSEETTHIFKCVSVCSPQEVQMALKSKKLSLLKQ